MPAPSARASCDANHLAECTIDFFQGPVLAPSRATALAGAFAAYAEGVDAIASNAAAIAVRAPYSVDWFDFDWTVGVSFPATFRRTDFDNDGHFGFTYGDFLFYTLGAEAQLGPWGIGLLGDFQTYDLLPTEGGPSVSGTETLGRLHALLGRSFFGGWLSVGAGVRAVTLTIDTSQNGQQTSQVQMNGLAPEIGVLVRPDFEPWRLGATFRAPVEGRAGSQGQAAGAPFVTPARILLPWELEIGAAIQVGPRPLNPRWLDPHEQEDRARQQIEEDRALRHAAQEAELAGIDEGRPRDQRRDQLAYQEAFVRREEDERLDRARQSLELERRARFANWPRERITVLLELLVSGQSTTDAVGLESFFSAQHSNGNTSALLRSGRKISYSPRLGLEGEPVPDRLQTRIGTYIEPSRFDTLPRQHFTFGFDLKLFPWGMFGLAGDQIWRVGAMTDLAPRYQSFGLSIGAWH